jgi:hypothetical protein
LVARWLRPSGLLAVLGGVLLLTIVAQIINANLVSDVGDATRYGEVHIPGSAVLKLPSGSLEVFVRASQPATPDAPPGLRLSVTRVGGDGPPGVLTSDRGGQFGITDRALDVSYRRVWRLELPQAGDYRVTASGVLTRDDPRALAFGHGPPASAARIWAFGGGAMLVVLLAWGVTRLLDRRSSDSGLPVG